MLRTRLFLILALLIAASAPSGAAPAGSTNEGFGPVAVRFYPIRLPDGSGYTLAHIGPQSGGADNRRFATKILEIAHEWTMERYREKYPGLVKELDQADDPFNANSTKFVIFKGNDVRDIQATIRVDRDIQAIYRGSDAVPTRLSGEKYLDLPLPRPMPEFKPLPYFLPPGMPGADQIQWTKYPVAQLGAVELKNFVTVRKAEHDFVPLLIYLSQYGANPDLADMPVKGFAEYPYSLATETGQDRGVAFAKDYFLACDPEMEGYYKRLGFEDVPPGHRAAKGVLLRTDREGFIKAWLNYFRKRKGAELIQYLSPRPLEGLEFADEAKLISRFLPDRPAEVALPCPDAFSALGAKRP